MFINFSLGSEEYLTVSTPTVSRVEHSGEISERNEFEKLPESSGSPRPLAIVLPTEIPCEVSKDALLFK